MPRIAPSTLRAMAEDLGFDLVGFGPADPGAHRDHFLAWLDAGRAGEMDYLHRNRERIAQPRRWAPAARGVVSLAQDYGGPARALQGGGRIARYAAGRDYHRSLGKRVQRLRRRLEAEGMGDHTMKGGTDAVPVLERALATGAGIGFLAKSSMVISPTLGPYLHLAELLLPQELPPDPPATGTCGTCTACLDACPTGAIVAPYQVDARRCLSYSTIELRGPVPGELRVAQGDRLFGCDDCLEVCPFTSRSPRRNLTGTDRPADLQPHRVVETWTLTGVLELGEEDYQEHWTGTAMRRATRSGLRRNAAIVLGNLGDAGAVPALERALGDGDPLVRGHAAWSLGRLGSGRRALDDARRREEDAWVRAELDGALNRG